MGVMNRWIAKQLRRLASWLSPPPPKPVQHPTALVWWLTASQCGRTDLPPDYPGIVSDQAPAGDDPRTWFTGSRADFEAYRSRVRKGTP